jgi:hypothetical protein
VSAAPAHIPEPMEGLSANSISTFLLINYPKNHTVATNVEKK